MSYQHNSRGVVAGGDTAASRRAPEPRPEELEQLIREGIDTMAHACDVIPAPRDAFNDASPKRARPLSMVKVGQLLVVLAKVPSLPAELLPAFAHRVYCWLLSLKPRPTDSLSRMWEASTLQQAHGDIAQARAVRAAETGDLAAVEDAIEATSRELAQDQHYLEGLFRTRRGILERRQSLPALRS